MSNITTIMTEFLLLGFSDTQALKILYSLLFFLLYSSSLMGNLLIVIITIFDRRLHTPMYFFLRNFSIVDACYISVTVPLASINSLLNNRVISYSGCAAQVFLLIFLAYFEITLLTVMAHDLYFAICHPLHYTVIMRSSVCMKMTLTCLVTVLFYSAFYTCYTFRLSSCQSNVIHQFSCDIYSLLTQDLLLRDISSILSLGVGCFGFIIASYSRIFSTLFRFPMKEQKSKAFSTFLPHIIVISLFVLSICIVYLQPTSESGSIKDIIFSISYTILIPFLNPIIYSLWNYQIKESIRVIMCRKLLLSNIA
ncbi:olfactory receptor 14C36-like [Macrotis lagotis]|uniref:olfactory receptor 14C36-like n=1 Tax=Macrotis lagotis TaxID=92651 RepID=UPI003D6978DE